jgi:hypothetical protein
MTGGLIGIMCLLVFLFFAWLMLSGRLPALLALPLMAVSIGLIGGIPGQEILSDVLGKGAVRLHVAFTTAMFGAMLAQLLTKTGITRQLIRWTAEYAGDDPFILGLTLTGLTALLFTTLGGLGTVIMLGTVILPIMLSVGIPAATAGGLFLMGINLGGLFNLGNWQLYKEVLNIPQNQIMNFVLPFGAMMGMIAIAFLAWELKKIKRSSLLWTGFLFFFASFLFFLFKRFPSLPDSKPFFLLAFALFTLFFFVQRLRKPQNEAPWSALLTPFVPLFLVLFFGWDILPAFMGGLLYGVLTTWRKNGINLLTSSIFEGASTSIPAVVLIMGIGMLLNAVMHPKVAQAIAPLLARVVPGHALFFVLVFALLAPLTLYRGPLSLWGMGSGLVGILMTTGLLPPPAIMGMLLSVGQIQGICDPTNTQNVWTANYLSINTGEVLRKTIAFAWLAALAGLIMTAFRFLPW